MSAAPRSVLGSTLAKDPRISNEPTKGKTVVPSELKACANVSRQCTVAEGPSSEINGFATTCTTVIPAATTNKASKNMPKSADEEAGMNKKQPAIMSTSPRTALRMYPIRRTTAAAGSETSRYAPKKADWTVITSAYESVNSSLSFGMITSFRLVIPPKKKNSAKTKIGK